MQPPQPPYESETGEETSPEASGSERQALKRLSPPFHLKHWKWFRLSLLVLVDIVTIVATFWFSFALRLDSFWPPDYIDVLLQLLPWVVAIHLAVYFAGGMYRQVWRYANLQSAMMVARCNFLAIALSVGAGFFIAARPMPRSVPVIYWLLATMVITMVRFSWRTWATYLASSSQPNKGRCLIYGAGAAGDLLARHIIANPKFPYVAVGFIDDDPNKRGRLIHGLKIYGTGQDLVKTATRFRATTVILAMPSAPGKTVRDAVELCHASGLKPLIMPDMASSLGEEWFQPRAVDVQDLLKRTPRATNHEEAAGFFGGQTVLVTGGGGSIGSEICRQVAAHKPKRLIILDSSEYNLYAIETELRDAKAMTGVEIVPVLGATTDEAVVDRLFAKYRPTQVFHAAAFKHVPLLEQNPLQGVINNIHGTYVLAMAARTYGVQRFLLISTDKAVLPSSVMGATKRCCELLIQALHTMQPKGPGGFVAVRFGNVLGSSGSVIPRFMQQIQAGGPVTVTHPKMTRYFMLTSEAVGLVIRAIIMSKGGEVFVLNMGDPVRIYDMARQLIHLAGKEPDRDIEIVFTGMRPGEKLHEELIYDEKEHRVIDDDLFIALPRAVQPEEVLAMIEKIVRAAFAGDEQGCLNLLWTLTGGVNETRAEARRPELESRPIH